MAVLFRCSLMERQALKEILVLLSLVSLCSCAPMAQDEPVPSKHVSTGEVPPAAATPAREDRSIVGTWRVVSVAGKPFPDPETGLFPNVQFDEHGFLSHWAGCGGAFPAFYELDGARIRITRREEVRIGKCAAPGDAERERALATALDAVSTWSLDDDLLTLTTGSGTKVVLGPPKEPIPALGGKWILMTIDGKPLGSDRSPVVTFSRGFLGAAADCNRLSAEYTADAQGGFHAPGPFATTEIGCAPADHAEDERLFGALNSVRSWEIERSGRLVLSGARRLVLRRPEGRENVLYIP